eukprot:6619979-Ditylum_brightwellii.AAC.1
MLYGPADRRWATRNAVSIDNGKYVAEAIGKGKAIAVSDGSFKNNRSAAACIIEGKYLALTLSPPQQPPQETYQFTTPTERAKWLWHVMA